MSLKHIMLGMLREPQSGYDIKKHFDQSLRNFWRAELSQIYPLLQKMQDDGLLTSKESESDIGPKRRVYKRTAKGGRALMQWLTAGPVVGNERVAYLAQVYFLAELGDGSRAIEYMQELRGYMAGWLETLEAAEEHWSSCNPLYPDRLPDKDFYAQLTLDMGLHKMRANLEWCDRSIERIRAREKLLVGD